MKKVLASALAFGLPVLALAQTVNISYWTGLLDNFQTILNTIVVILIALAVLYFIWNVFKYIQSGDDVDKKAAASGMVFGIVGIAVIVSVWGLVSLLQTTFLGNGLSTTGPANNINNLLPRN